MSYRFSRSLSLLLWSSLPLLAPLFSPLSAPSIPPRSHKHNHSFRSLSSSLLSGEEVSGRARRGSCKRPFAFGRGLPVLKVLCLLFVQMSLGNGVAFPLLMNLMPAYGPFVSTGLSQGIFDAPARTASCVSPSLSPFVSSHCSWPSLSLPLSSSTRKRTHTSLFPLLSPSIRHPPSLLLPLFSPFPIRHRTFFSGRIGGRADKEQGKG